MTDRVAASYEFGSVFRSVEQWVRSKEEQLSKAGETSACYNLQNDPTDDQTFNRVYQTFEQNIDRAMANSKISQLSQNPKEQQGSSIKQQQLRGRDINNKHITFTSPSSSSRSFEKNNESYEYSSNMDSKQSFQMNIPQRNIRSNSPLNVLSKTVLYPLKQHGLQSLSPPPYFNKTVSFIKKPSQNHQNKEKLLLNPIKGQNNSKQKQNNHGVEFKNVCMPDNESNVEDYLRNTDENLKQVENDLFNKHFLSTKTLFNDHLFRSQTGFPNSLGSSKYAESFSNMNNKQILPNCFVSKQFGKTNTTLRNFMDFNEQKQDSVLLPASSGTSPKRVLERQFHQSLDSSIVRLFGMLREEQNKGMEFNLKEPVICLQILNSLFESSNETLYQCMACSLQNYLFCNDSGLIAELSHLKGINLKTKKYSYRQLCRELSNQLQLTSLQCENSNQASESRVADLESQMETLRKTTQNTIQQLNDFKIQCENNVEIERNQLSETVGAKSREITKLQDELASHKKQLKTQEGIFLQHETELKMIIKSQDTEFSQNIKSLEDQINKLNNLNYQQSTKMFAMQDSYATQLISIRTFKERIQDLESKINLIVEENHRLNARAGTNFFELTPRPTFESIDMVLNQNGSAQQENNNNAINNNINNANSSSNNNPAYGNTSYVDFKSISTQKKVEYKAKSIQKFVADLKQTYEERINVLITQSQQIQTTENKKKAKVVIKSQQNRMRDVGRNYYQPSFLQRKSFVVGESEDTFKNEQDKQNQ